VWPPRGGLIYSCPVITDHDKSLVGSRLSAVLFHSSIMPAAPQNEHLQTEDLPQSHLVPIDQAPKKRRPYGSKQAVYGVGTRIVTPAGVFAKVINPVGNSTSVGHVPLGEDMEMEIDGDGGVSVMYAGAGEEVAAGGHVEDSEEIRRVHKKERQWRKWSEDVIPVLLKPYLTLMRETQSLRHIERIRDKRGCTGCIQGRLLEVSCIYFNRR